MRIYFIKEILDKIFVNQNHMEKIKSNPPDPLLGEYVYHAVGINGSIVIVTDPLYPSELIISTLDGSMSWNIHSIFDALKYIEVVGFF
jgi:hypothetical protein